MIFVSLKLSAIRLRDQSQLAESGMKYNAAQLAAHRADKQ